MKMQPKFLHIKIKEARLSSVFNTQKLLAKHLGVTAGAISQWEADDPKKRTVPSLENLMALANVTKRRVGWFLDGECKND